MTLLKNFTKTGILKYLSVFFLFTIIVIASDPALAASACKGGSTANGLGNVICNVFKSTDTVPGLLAGFSYLCGIILGFMGILKLKDHVESPNQVQIWDPLKRFLAGGAFLALPMVIRAAITTVAKGTSDVSGNQYKTGGATGEGLDAKLVALMQDVWEPLQFLFLGFGYLAGIILILIGISRLLKSEQEGPRGPMGIGTIITFIVAGVLLSLNKILGAAVFSVFNSGLKNQASLSYKDGMSATAVGHAEAVIGAIMAFVAIIGWISFIRGFFIMRGVAEGNSQASAMAGVTHIIGGAIAVNLGAFIQAVQNTLGITKYGLTIGSLDSYTTMVSFIA